MKVFSIKNKIFYVFTILIILSHTCFASIISENDASGFITKAEFDLFRSYCDDKINNYGLDIDSIIDGAITSYLDRMNAYQWENEHFDTSILKFPLKIYSTSSYNSTSLKPWTPSYRLYTRFSANIVSYPFIKEYSALNLDTTIVKNFLDGEIVGSGSSQYFKANEQLSSYDATYTAFNDIVNWGGTPVINSSLTQVFGLIINSNTGQDKTQHAATDTINYPYSVAATEIFDTASTINATGSYYFSTPTTNAEPNLNWTYDSSGKKWVVSGAGSFYYGASGDVFKNGSWDINYYNEKINEIFQNSSAWVPVCYNGKVKFTNNPDVASYNFITTPTRVTLNKLDTYFGGTYYGRLDFFSLPYYVIMDIDKAKSLNPSTSISTKWDTSLLKPSDIHYDITDTATGVKSDHIMSNGIYLFTAKKKCRVNFRIRAFANGTTRIFFRKNPIENENYNDANNIILDENSKFTTLNSGVLDSIQFDVNANDKIYYKILNADNDVTIEEIRLSTYSREID